VYSVARRVANARVRLTRRKFRKLRIYLSDPQIGWGWPYATYPKQEAIATLTRNQDGTTSCTIDSGGPRNWFNEELAILHHRPALDPAGRELIDFGGDPINLKMEHYLRDELGRLGVRGEDCQPMVLAVRAVTNDEQGNEVRGEVQAREPDTSNAGPLQRDRNDQPFLFRIKRIDNLHTPVDPTDDVAVGSGVIYSNSWPEVLYQYVLAHELGHYFGLAHLKHSIKDIMFTSAPTQGTTWWPFGYYLESEPEFTYVDGETSWRFIGDEMKHCLAPEEVTNVGGRPSTRIVSDTHVDDDRREPKGG